ncbi:MAG: P-type conjugative transfer ATPase TrbB [Burkholderiales bacterium]|jgi:type IV secretion system protein VirB11|nr:P-type conjugative transfer ATPase TrbB [Burkholderiales bacterium]
MSKEVPVSDIVTFLETDLKEVMEVLKRPLVYEVMLNAYLAQNGTYEGHLWYEEDGVGMKRLTTQTQHKINNYPIPKVGDLVVIKATNHGNNILNYHVLPKDKNIFKILKMALCYTLHQNSDKQIYLEQEEHYKLNELANNIQNGYFYYKHPISPDLTINDIIEEINNQLKKINIVFELHLIEITDLAAVQFQSPKYLISKQFQKLEYTRAEQIIGILASANELFAHKKEPIVECQIPYYGHRFTSISPPASKFPLFTIRKHSSRVISLDDYVRQGVMPESVADILRRWVERRFNVLVAGGMGSGKTTLLNSLLHEVALLTPTDRVGIIEDTPELQWWTVDNSIAIAQTMEVDIPKLLRTAWRMRLNRIWVGEIRGKEAYTLLKAMMSGTPGGMASIHADGAAEAIYRFEQCMLENSEAQNVSKGQIAGAINGIVSIQKVTILKEVNGIWENTIKRKVTAVRQITGYDVKHQLYTDQWLYKDPESYMLTTDGSALPTDDFSEYQSVASTLEVD